MKDSQNSASDPLAPFKVTTQSPFKRRGNKGLAGGPGRKSGGEGWAATGHEYLRKRSALNVQTLVDWVLANPGRPMTDAALFFDVTPQYIYILRHTDMFSAHLKARQAKISQGVDELLTATALQALEKLGQVLENAPSEKAVVQSCDMLLDKMGYGAKSESPSGVSLTVNQQVFNEASGILKGKVLEASDVPARVTDQSSVGEGDNEV